MGTPSFSILTWHASLTSLVERSFSRSSILTLSQFITWLWFLACSATADLSSDSVSVVDLLRVLIGADLESVSVRCSLMRTPKVRPVSPMYT